MSDIPDGYYVGHDGSVLLDYRRDFIDFPNPLYGYNKAGGRGNKSLGSKRPALLKRDGSDCHYCEKPMAKPSGTRPPRGRVMTVEHVYPRSLGGGNGMNNLVLCCYKCNQAMGSRLDKCDCDFCVRAIESRGREE